MIELYITGDGLLFWTLAEAQEHVDEVRDCENVFLSCECMNQEGIAENWAERNAIINNN